MQESILSLMQMAKTSAALAKLNEQADCIYPLLPIRLLAAFRRVLRCSAILLLPNRQLFWIYGQTCYRANDSAEAPDNFQTAEFNLKHGQLDKVVHRKDMRPTLIKLLDMHGVKEDGYLWRVKCRLNSRLRNCASKIEELRKFGTEKQIDFTDEIRRLEERYIQLEDELYANLTVQRRKCRLARHPQRPTTMDYIQDYFYGFH